jgi:hypothetical protein
MKAIIEFSKHGIVVPTGRTHGQHKAKCPQCIDGHRNKHDKSLSANLSNGLFNCHRCGFKGCATDNGKHWSENIPQKQPEKQIEFLDEKIMLRTMTAYEHNSFTVPLKAIFDEKQIDRIIKRYQIGTKKDGACFFFQVDTLGRFRYGKVMYFLPDPYRVVKRDQSKKPFGIHKLMSKEYNHRQCFFGEHLLILPESTCAAHSASKNKVVAIVESEKTACICSEAMPDYVWLATGGSSFGIDVSVYDGLVKIAPGTKDDIADHIIADLMRRKQQPPPQQPATVIDEGKTSRVTDNPIVAAMCAKNPALSRLMTMFDCELTHVDTYEPQPSRMLTNDELKRLALRLPDFNSWTETELCQLLKIEPQHVRSLTDNREIYHIQLTGKYCRSGCTPF